MKRNQTVVSYFISMDVRFEIFNDSNQLIDTQIMSVSKQSDTEYPIEKDVNNEVVEEAIQGAVKSIITKYPQYKNNTFKYEITKCYSFNPIFQREAKVPEGWISYYVVDVIASVALFSLLLALFSVLLFISLDYFIDNRDKLLYLPLIACIVGFGLTFIQGLLSRYSLRKDIENEEKEKNKKQHK